MNTASAGMGKAVLRYVALTAAAALLVVLFRIVIPVNQTTVALAFLILVLLTASRWRLAYSVYVSILCTFLYNFFFLPPVGRLTIAAPSNWVALGAFLCTSVLVSHLSNKERRQAETSEARRLEVEQLYEFSQQLLLQEDFRAVARALPALTASVFGFSAVALYIHGEEAGNYSDPGKLLPPVIDLKLAAAQPDAGVTARDGAIIIPLSLGMRSLGALAVSDAGVSTRVCEAIGSLVAIALERATALERSSHLEAWHEGERLRTALVDSVTHDLRTPLTAIRAAATTLASQTDLPEADRADLVTVIDEESARLDRLIGQAVEMAQLDAETVQVHAELQDVAEVIEITADEMRTLFRDHPIELEIPADLPRVSFDRELVHRILRHVLENAAKYSPSGSPISLSAARDEYRLLVTVSDRGPGIEPDDQPFVFDKFFRGKRRQTAIGGTGMGLAIVKAILEAHGGGIEVSSRPEEGASFTLWLPLSGA